VGFWDLAWVALGLLLVAEGFLPFLSPQTWRTVFAKALQMSDGQLRFCGLVGMLLGLALLLVFQR
jgi:uncharacterized protein YjeT (DUF2065 family)